MCSELKIQQATSKQLQEEIYRLRYRVFVEEMNFTPDHADHESETVREPLDDRRFHFCARDGDQVVGAIRSNMRKDGPLQLEEHYDLDQFSPYHPFHISMTTKTVVDPDYRGMKIIRELAKAAYRCGLENDIYYDFIDCSPHLIPFYEWLGHRPYTSSFLHPDTGIQTPMVLVLQDIDHLQAVGSPFCDIAAEYDLHGAGIPQFRDRFGDYARKHNHRLQSSEELYRRIERKLGSSPEQTLSLLDGIETEQARTFLTHGTLIHVNQGTAISRKDEDRREIFTLLSGRIQLHNNHDGTSRTLQPGDSCGLAAFLHDSRRQTHIVAESDAQLLVHHPTRLNRLLQSDANFSAQFYKNIVRTIEPHPAEIDLSSRHAQVPHDILTGSE